MIDDEFDVKIIDEISMDYSEIIVIYVNDYSIMNHCQFHFWINGFWEKLVGDMYEGLGVRGVETVRWNWNFWKK